jgi:hypothetical protein
VLSSFVLAPTQTARKAIVFDTLTNTVVRSMDITALMPTDMAEIGGMDDMILYLNLIIK